MTTKSSSATIQREIDRVGGECVAAGDDARLWKLGDGRLVIEANGEPVWEDDDGFDVAAMNAVAEAGVGMHYESAEWQALRDLLQWHGWWPVIDGDGEINGRITEGGEGDDDYLNVDDEAMIATDDARAAGWRTDTEEGTAAPSEPVTVEFATADETIGWNAGLREMAPSDHPAQADACAAYRRAAIIAMADDDRANRLRDEAPRDRRTLHSQWCGAHWGYSAGAIGTMAGDLTSDERAAIDAAHEAGLDAARKVIEERDASTYGPIEAVLASHGDRFAGNNVRDAAEDWDDHGFNAEEVDAWATIGCWDAATAAEWRDAGLSPAEVAATVDAICSSDDDDLIYSVCNGERSPEVVTEAAQGE
jgi:hypothetical protein